MNSNTEISLGEKIKIFRKRAKISQLQLEISIEAAPGSISRIENNEKNPTKETLLKIANYLKLSSEEIAYLFDIKLPHNILSNYRKQIDVINEINSMLEEENVNIDKLFDLIINKLINIMDLKVPGIYTFDSEKQSLIVRRVSVPRIFMRIAEKSLNKKVNRLYFSINEKNNLLVKAYLSKEIQISPSLYYFAIPYLNKGITDLLQSIVRVKTVLAIPLITKKEVLGVLSVGSDKTLIDPVELEVLKTFANQLGIAIKNVKQIHNLSKEIEILKNVSEKSLNLDD